MSEEKKGFFNRLKSGLTKTRDNIVAGIDAVFYGASEIDEDFYEELEEILIMGDIGVNATNDIIERMKDEVKKRHLRLPSECKELLVESIKEQMRVGDTAYDFEKEQSVIFIIGVNGVGKTTSVGKLAGILKGQGRKVLIAAADTFRAAAGDQLAEWANRAGVDMIGGNEGADPASVIYDAVNAAKARNVDVLICDTAGRLHNKKNLMEELKKMNRIIDREFPNAHRENLIVLDGTTGQNALSQAREFGEVANLTGVILTKMDGTAKGGIAVAIQSELNVPVKYIGVGETIDDLQKFNADEFVDALFDIKREDADTEVEDVGDSLSGGVEANTDEIVTEVKTDVESSGTDVEDMSITETQSAESGENILPNEAPEIKFSWGDEEEEQIEEQPKKKKWGFWK
jgi:fused signal recognition particle receptor